jgi:hypothetical protein
LRGTPPQGHEREPGSDAECGQNPAELGRDHRQLGRNAEQRSGQVNREAAGQELEVGARLRDWIDVASSAAHAETEPLVHRRICEEQRSPRSQGPQANRKGFTSADQLVGSNVTEQPERRFAATQRERRAC